MNLERLEVAGEKHKRADTSILRAPEDETSSSTASQFYSEMVASSSSPSTNWVEGFWHDGMLNHDTGRGVLDTGSDPGFLDVVEKQPENPDWVRNMVSILKRGPISPFNSWHTAAPALISQLLSFHSLEYIKELVEANKNGGEVLCSGTFLDPGSWDAALLAAGNTLSAMKHILNSKGKIRYALVRPPGHHAQPSQADGTGDGRCEYAMTELVVPAVESFKPEMVVLVVGQDLVRSFKWKAALDNGWILGDWSNNSQPRGYTQWRPHSHCPRRWISCYLLSLLPSRHSGRHS
ncbi:hypothetical protein NL676_004642 [Syzygium grande]|nr:hypothetical protein NL676_004642 [Syzygium grande]